MKEEVISALPLGWSLYVIVSCKCLFCIPGWDRRSDHPDFCCLLLLLLCVCVPVPIQIPCGLLLSLPQLASVSVCLGVRGERSRNFKERGDGTSWG